MDLYSNISSISMLYLHMHTGTIKRMAYRLVNTFSAKIFLKASMKAIEEVAVFDPKNLHVGLMPRRGLF